MPQLRHCWHWGACSGMQASPVALLPEHGFYGLQFSWRSSQKKTQGTDLAARALTVSPISIGRGPPCDSPASDVPLTFCPNYQAALSVA